MGRLVASEAMGRDSEDPCGQITMTAKEHGGQPRLSTKPRVLEEGVVRGQHTPPAPPTTPAASPECIPAGQRPWELPCVRQWVAGRLPCCDTLVKLALSELSAGADGEGGQESPGAPSAL